MLIDAGEKIRELTLAALFGLAEHADLVRGGGLVAGERGPLGLRVEPARDVRDCAKARLRQVHITSAPSTIDAPAYRQRLGTPSGEVRREVRGGQLDQQASSDQRLDRVEAVVDGEVASARQRLEAELAWLESAGADERARARPGGAGGATQPLAGPGGCRCFDGGRLRRPSSAPLGPD